MTIDEAWSDALFEPLRIGPLTARSRVMMPPHSSAIGNLWGTDDEAEQAIAYLRHRADAGVAWTTIPGRISNVLNPGFEPSGISAVVHGPFRGSNYVERVGTYVEAMHTAGALAATQLTMNGGYPHAPSARFAQPVNFLAPHVISRSELELLLEEYRFSAATAKTAGIDILELHMNHEDLTHQFLSQRINTRTDEFGGSFDNRLRFPLEVLRVARNAIGADRVLGVRMNLEDPRSYDLAEGLSIARRIAESGLVDYFHMVYGSTWGNPSYIQPHFFSSGQWAPLAREYQRALNLPVIYTGLVNTARRAAEIVASGDADMVGMARAHIADGELLAKVARGQEQSVRLCVGVNDCINRRYVDGLPFGCAVNPHVTRELEGTWGETERIDRRLLVVGAGPAGMELAALAAEAGAAVTLVERGERVGGQLHIASLAPSFGRYADYLSWQSRRLERAGVEVRLGTEVDTAMLAGVDADTSVAFATGAVERIPDIRGVDRPHVLQSREVLQGASVGQRVAVIIQDDHMAPLAAVEAIAARGSDVTAIYSSHIPAQLLGRYSVGSVLGRLDALGVVIRIMEEVVEIGESELTVRHVYSDRESELGPFDSVVLACGGQSDAALYEGLAGSARRDVHILGDAYAPRRLVFATRQALAVAKVLAEPVRR